jgi:O-antigen/teichoic acid export membrane protein
MSADVQTFLKNLLYVSIGTIISTLFVAVVTIIGGRILGPAEYGKFSLIQSISMFLYLPMILGYNSAMVKYVSEKEESGRQFTIIITTCILVLILTIISSSIYLFFSRQISNLLSTSNEIIIYSCILAVLFVFYTITTNIIRALNKMKTYSFFQSLYAMILIFSFIMLIIYKMYSYQSLIYPMFLGYGITGIIILILIFKNDGRYKFDRSWAKILTKYALFSALGGLSFVLYSNIDTIMISKYMIIEDVGIYNAYYTASINVAAVISGIFLTVYFPAVSKYNNKQIIFLKINKIIPYIIIGGLPFIMVCEYIIVILYGNKYPINIEWIILFAIASILIGIEGIYAWLLASTDPKGALLVSFASVIGAVVNVGLNFVLIPLIGIIGAISSLILCFMFFITLTLLFSKKYFKEPNSDVPP